MSEHVDDDVNNALDRVLVDGGEVIELPAAIYSGFADTALDPDVEVAMDIVDAEVSVGISGGGPSRNDGAGFRGGELDPLLATVGKVTKGDGDGVRLVPGVADGDDIVDLGQVVGASEMSQDGGHDATKGLGVVGRDKIVVLRDG